MIEVNAELKAMGNVNRIWQAQLLSHLKLNRRATGFLINFNVPVIKNGIQRIVRLNETLRLRVLVAINLIS